MPLMKAAIRLPSATLVRAATVAVDVSVEYLSGGPAKGLPVTLSSQVNDRSPVEFPDFDRFTFANGAVKEGVRQERGMGRYQRRDSHRRPSARHPDARRGRRRAHLDNRYPSCPDPGSGAGRIEYRDPNGEGQTVSNSLTIWPAQAAARNPRRTMGSVARRARSRRGGQSAGQARGRRPGAAHAVQPQDYSYRQRLVGGFYAYENTTETRKAGELCSRHH